MDMTPEEIREAAETEIRRVHNHGPSDTLCNEDLCEMQAFIKGAYWMREYGELKQSPRELLERTWDAAVAITHWEERNAEWSKCTLPDKETFINSILSESPKEEAVEFAEWAVNNYDWHFVYWSSRKNPLNGEFSTSQLYNLFKQTK